MNAMRLSYRATAKTVKDLDALIPLLDATIERAGIEKIRTAGIGYVAAAGLPAPQIVMSGRAQINAEHNG